jgi:hypothetical protein
LSLYSYQFIFASQTECEIEVIATYEFKKEENGSLKRRKVLPQLPLPLFKRRGVEIPPLDKQMIDSDLQKEEEQQKLDAKIRNYNCNLGAFERNIICSKVPMSRDYMMHEHVRFLIGFRRLKHEFNPKNRENIECSLTSIIYHITKK